MKNKIFIPLLALLLFLGACGEDSESNLNEEQLSETDTELVEDKNDKANDEAYGETNEDNQDEEANSSDEEATNKDESTSESNQKSNNKNSSQSVEGDLKAHFIDVGQGDATLIQYSSGGKNYTILIDAGDWNSNNVVNYLNSQNVKHIDLLVGTHEHADHIGQMDKILNQFSVDEVWLTGNVTTSKTFERVIDAIEASDAGYYEPRAGETFNLGPLKIDVLHPSSLSGNLNNDSISMKLTYGTTTFLFTGDTEKSGENAILNRGYNIKADILQLGHHGSSTSSTPSFIKAVNPEVAIYSAGKDNSYGHPHVEVVNLMLDSGIKLYGTDVHGTVIVTTDGNSYSVKTNKNGTITRQTAKQNTNDSSKNAKSNNDSKQVTAKQPNKNDSSKKEEKQVTQPSNNSCVNINTASFEELQRIKHIGPDRAQQIIDLRPFKSVDDLTRVKGIAEGRLKDIKAENIACVGG